MKINKLSLIPMLALGGLMALGSMATAQDNKDAGGTPPAGGPPPGGGRRGGMPTVEQRLERLTTALSLTDEEKPKVKAVLEESSKAMQGLRDLPQEERGAKRQEVMEAEGKKMKAILTSEQYEKYQKMPRGRGPGGGAGGPGAGGPPPAGSPPAGEKKAGN